MRAVGIILAGGNNNKMRELTQRRAHPEGSSTYSV